MRAPRRTGEEPGLSHRAHARAFALIGTDYSRRFLGFGRDVQLNGGQLVTVPYWFLAAAAAARLC